MCQLVATPSEGPSFMEFVFSIFFALLTASYSTPWNLKQLSVLFLAASHYVDWEGPSE